MRKRNSSIGDAPGGCIKDEPEQKVWGAFFGQSAMARKAVVSRASVGVV